MQWTLSLGMLLLYNLKWNLDDSQKHVKLAETEGGGVDLDVSVLACHNQLNSMPLISSWIKNSMMKYYFSNNSWIE